MSEYPLSKAANIYFIGIGGIGMSGLCKLLFNEGFSVSGSDIAESKITDSLVASGINVAIGHSPENIKADTGLVVYTAAVKSDNPELIRARSLGIRCIERSELLGLVMSRYKKSIAVSGTHGKTTTSSMIASILSYSGLRPSAVIGGIVPSVGDSFLSSREGDYFVAETCEYFDGFLNAKPHMAVILNIEPEHIDFFESEEHMFRSFRAFAENVPACGCLVINKAIRRFRLITEGLPCRIAAYSMYEKENCFHAENIKTDHTGKNSFTVYFDKEPLVEVRLGLYGRHNIENSLAAFAAAYSLGVSAENISGALSLFEGALRRFERKGSFGGVTVIDDYAHHPTEIRATLEAARSVCRGKIYCIFQPHTFSRTKYFLNDFASAFTNADVVMLVDIYASREKFLKNISSKDLVSKLSSNGKDAQYFPDFASAEAFAREKCQKGDLLITMGAGDVYLIGNSLVGQ